MVIEDLDLETRYKIYGHTRKILRKYQKGILTGKLTANKFAENILSDDDIKDIINDDLLTQAEFKSSYISYIQTLMDNQSKGDVNKKNKTSNKSTISKKVNIADKIKLKSLLTEYDFELCIPIQYLNNNDIENIIKYISTGEIQLGDERIYNYVHKLKKH